MSVYVVLGVEFDFDIGFCVAPQKPGKNWEKHDVRTFFFRGMSAPIFFATDPLHEPSRKFFAIFLARARPQHALRFLASYCDFGSILGGARGSKNQ